MTSSCQSARGNRSQLPNTKFLREVVNTQLDCGTANSVVALYYVVATRLPKNGGRVVYCRRKPVSQILCGQAL